MLEFGRHKKKNLFGQFYIIFYARIWRTQKKKKQEKLCFQISKVFF
jgi:hypothetical protein